MEDAKDVGDVLGFPQGVHKCIHRRKFFERNETKNKVLQPKTKRLKNSKICKEWETETARFKIRGKVLQITKSVIENNENRMKYYKTDYQYGNKNQNIENGRQQNIPTASRV